jgi:hypothetical protein
MTRRFIALTAVATALSGCGGGGPEQTVQDFTGAYAGKDFDGACQSVASRADWAGVTAAALKQAGSDIEKLDKFADTLEGKSSDQEACAAFLRVASGLDPGRPQRLEDAKTERVDESEARATVATSEGSWKLAKVEGDWKLSGLAPLVP